MRLPLAIVVLVLPALMPAGFAISADRVVVVCNCEVDAYREALDGIREALGRPPKVLAADAAMVARAASLDPGRVYIAVGRDALQASRRGELAVVGAMMLHEDVAAEGAASAAQIELDVPPRMVLQEIRRLFPGKTRVGVLAPPGLDQAALAARARELGLTLEFAGAAGPAGLLKAFLSLKGRADLVVTLPDGALYNSATVRPLVMASIEQRLPLIGFSAAFVRAGAAAGVFADFRDAGRQAAETALSYEPGRGARAPEPPRRWTVAVNQRVLRLLGLEYQPSAAIEVFR
jgi:putative tryptophan/tyrosine transport system substrate-binding protein